MYTILRFKKRLRKNAGFALLEVMIAAGVVGIIAGGVATMTANMMRQQKQDSNSATASMIFRQLASNMNNDVAWQQMVGMAVNGNLSCLSTAQGCNPLNVAKADAADCVLSAGGLSCSGVPLNRISEIIDSDARAVYTYAPDAGYTWDGQPCTGFSWDASSGNDQCPLHFDVFWWPTCAANENPPCADATVHLAIRPTFHPGKHTTFSFNADNYGSWNYARGSEPYNPYQVSMNADARVGTNARAFTCDWIYDPAFFYLSQACAHTGLGTADATNAMFNISQGANGYAQVWSRPPTGSATPSNYVYMDAGSQAGYPVLSSNIPLRISAAGTYALAAAVTGTATVQPGVSTGQLVIEQANPPGGGGRLSGQVGIALPSAGANAYPIATADVNGSLHLSGVATQQSYTAQGSYYGWNVLNFTPTSSIAGETDFVNNRGLGTGGWGYFDAANTTRPLMFISADVTGQHYGGGVGIGGVTNPDTRLTVQPNGINLGSIPNIWPGGIHTWDMVAEGSLAVGHANGQFPYNAVTVNGAYFATSPHYTGTPHAPFVETNSVTVSELITVNGGNLKAGNVTLQGAGSIYLDSRAPYKPGTLTHLPRPACNGDYWLHWNDATGFECVKPIGPCNVTYTVTRCHYESRPPPAHQVCVTTTYQGFNGTTTYSGCLSAANAVAAAHGNSSIQSWYPTSHEN